MVLSGLSDRIPVGGAIRSSCGGTPKAYGVVEVVVLLLDRPLKTESRLGVGANAVDLDREWAECSGGSTEPLVDGRSPY